MSKHTPGPWRLNRRTTMRTSYTNEELDQVHEVKERITEAVTALVDQMTEGLAPEVDDLVRVQLTEQYRFWR